MIHGETRSISKPFTEEEIKQKHEKAEKINFHIQNFLEARKNLSLLPPETLFEMTFNLSQMSPEIYTIYNVRRELITNSLSLSPAESKDRYDLLLKELDLVNFLLKKQAKSYSLFTHRQWIITQGLTEEKSIGIDITEGLIPKELYFCAKMLEKDERNFHVWNYRDWLIELSKSLQFSIKEESFTKLKIEQNFTNFSALHFRAGNFLRLYAFRLETIENLEEKKEIEAFGLPLEIIEKELEFITTGLYMQTNEQGIWQYHRWLIELMVPIYIVKIGFMGEEDDCYCFFIVLSRKCRNFKDSNLEITLNNEVIDKFMIKNVRNIEFSQFYTLSIPKDLFKMEEKTYILDIHVRNPYKNLLERDCTQDYNRKRFFLQSNFKFLYENTVFKLILHNYYSEEDLKFKNFAEKLFINAKNIVKEILELENNNKFVLMQQNFLLEARFPVNPVGNLEKVWVAMDITRKIIENLIVLTINYEKQRFMFEKFIEFYEARLEIEEKLEIKEKIFDLEKIRHLERFEELLGLLIMAGVKTISDLN